MKAVALRVKPGQDPLAEIERFIEDRKIDAACILTCVGSLTRACLRYADQPETAVLVGRFEIVSLTGVLSCAGSHCHIAISDATGKTTGAHLMEGSAVYTTAEIVIGVLPGNRFLRIHDPETGYPELEIITASQKKE